MTENIIFTPDEFRRRREALGLTQDQLARLLRTDVRTVRRWEATDVTSSRQPNPISCAALEWFAQGWRPPEWPACTGPI